MDIIKGAADIQKAIDSIANRGAKLDSSIQQAGLSILAHIEQHSDSTLADKLINAMPRGGRKLALVEWMLAYGKVRKLDGKDKAEAQAIKAGRVFQFDGARKTDMEQAAAKPWHEFKKEKLEQAFDAQAALSNVLTRLRNADLSKLTPEQRAAAKQHATEILAALG